MDSKVTGDRTVHRGLVWSGPPSSAGLSSLLLFLTRKKLALSRTPALFIHHFTERFMRGRYKTQMLLRHQHQQSLGQNVDTQHPDVRRENSVGTSIRKN